MHTNYTAFLFWVRSLPFCKQISRCWLCCQPLLTLMLTFTSTVITGVICKIYQQWVTMPIQWKESGTYWEQGDCSYPEALMLTPCSRIYSVVHSVYVEVVICFITSNFDIRIWLTIRGCWLYNSISEHTCGHKDSLKVKMSTQIVLASQVAGCDVRNTAEYSRQNICYFVSKLRAEVEAEANTQRWGIQGTTSAPTAALTDVLWSLKWQWHGYGAWVAF